MSATCDTSVLVPALIPWHPDHDTAREAVSRDVTTLTAHVVLECYSVLTRLPAPHRIPPAAAAEAISALTHPVATLPADAHKDLVVRLSRDGIRGGAIYDALVAATSLHHDLTLLTRDRRARPAYDAVGVRCTYL